jgi:hypothetical protein
MAIALKQGTNGNLARFLAADSLQIASVEPRVTTNNLVIGSLLTGGAEVVLGHAANADARVLKDLILDANIVGGAGAGTIGSGVGDYFTDVWVQAVNDNGPDNLAYGLRVSGTNAGAYSIGIDPSLLSNVTATDLMTGLDELDAAISAASGDQDTRLIENGVTLAAGDAVAVSTTASGQVTAANADSANLEPDFIGIAITGGTGDGATVNCTFKLIGQPATSGTGLTIGQAVYVPDLTVATTGEPPATTAPSGTGDLAMRVGWAIQATEIFIAPGPGIIV